METCVPLLHARAGGRRSRPAAAPPGRPAVPAPEGPGGRWAARAVAGPGGGTWTRGCSPGSPGSRPGPSRTLRPECAELEPGPGAVSGGLWVGPAGRGFPPAPPPSPCALPAASTRVFASLLPGGSGGSDASETPAPAGARVLDTVRGKNSGWGRRKREAGGEAKTQTRRAPRSLGLLLGGGIISRDSGKEGDFRDTPAPAVTASFLPHLGFCREGHGRVPRAGFWPFSRPHLGFSVILRFLCLGPVLAVVWVFPSSCNHPCSSQFPSQRHRPPGHCWAQPWARLSLYLTLPDPALMSLS